METELAVLHPFDSIETGDGAPSSAHIPNANHFTFCVHVRKRCSQEHKKKSETSDEDVIYPVIVSLKFLAAGGPLRGCEEELIVTTNSMESVFVYARSFVGKNKWDH